MWGIEMKQSEDHNNLNNSNTHKRKELGCTETELLTKSLTDSMLGKQIGYQQ